MHDDREPALRALQPEEQGADERPGGEVEGAATLAGLRRLYDDGAITREDRVVLMNTGATDGGTVPSVEVPEVKTAEQVRQYLGLTPRAS